MASIFKKQITRPLPSGAEIEKRNHELWARWADTHGKKQSARVFQSEGGEQRIRRESATWYIRYRNASGVFVEENTGCRDKSAAAGVLNERIKAQERIKAGIVTATESGTMDHARVPLKIHLADFEAHMEARRLNPDYIKTTQAQLNRVFTACGFTHIADLSRPEAERWLSLRTIESKMGARVRNAHATALTNFGNWLVKNNRTITNPFTGMVKLNERADRRRERRALTLDEIARLLHAAENRSLQEALTVRRGENKGKLAVTLRPQTRARLVREGRERALIYKTLLLTGLRFSEMRSIKLAQVKLDGQTPHIVLYARDEKARRGAQIPLQADLAQEIGIFLAERLKLSQNASMEAGKPIPARLDPRLPLFDMPGSMRKVFDADLVYAGIAFLDKEGNIQKRDEHNRTLDIHALRHTFGTLLSKAGVPLQVAQRAMRHSDPKLTSNVYTHLGLLDISGAVSALPTIGADIASETETKSAAVNEGEEVAPIVALIPDKPCAFESFHGKDGRVSVVKAAHDAICRIANNDGPIRTVASVGNVKGMVPGQGVEPWTSRSTI